MKQKVIKVGSSAAVTIPKKSLETLGLSIGSSVVVSVDPKTRHMVVEAADVSTEHVVDIDTLHWTRDFIAEYREALEELADK